MDIKQYKKNIETTFDDVAGRYDENRFFSISAKRMVELLPSLPSMDVLDLSTGTGAVAVEVAKRFSHARIEAIDLSQGMLDRAQSKAQNKGLSNISFKLRDVDDMPYGNESFDIVTCGYGLFFYPDMEVVYQKICRTIKEGGFFIFSSFTKDAFNPCSELFLNRLQNMYAIEIPPDLKEKLRTEEQIEELAKTADIERVKVEFYSISYPITVNDWWALLNNAGYKSFLAQLDSKQLLRFKVEHLQEIEQLSVDGMVELNSDTLFGLVTI